MGTSSKASDTGKQGTLEDMRERLALVERGLSELHERRLQLESDAARQAQRVEHLTVENSELKATRSELRFDLNASRENLVAAKQEYLLLEHDNEALRRSEDRLIGVQAELAETKEQLASTQRSVVLLEHDNEDLRQRESELLRMRSDFVALREEHAPVVERQTQDTKRLEDRENDLGHVRGELADALAEVERLQLEQRRLSDANERARRRNTHLEMMYDMARIDSNELDSLACQLTDGVQLMMASRRWRLGHMLLSLPRRAVFRGNPPMVTDSLVALVGTYRESRRSASREWRRLAGAEKTEPSDVT